VRIIRVDPARDEIPRHAIEALRAGSLVAFPTETYYALGADAGDPDAVARVFAAKRRPSDAAIPVLLAGRDQWPAVARDIPEPALRLADRFWPGALTIVCRRADDFSSAVAGGGETIGARVPAAPVAAGLCRAVGPVVGTSANTHGMPAPVTAIEVALDLGKALDIILDGGRCAGSRPSTVIDVTRVPPMIVRLGAVGMDALRDVLGEIAPVQNRGQAGPA
jgi:L-threonylcarbamoyladenylate synthase